MHPSSLLLEDHTVAMHTTNKVVRKGSVFSNSPERKSGVDSVAGSSPAQEIVLSAETGDLHGSRESHLKRILDDICIRFINTCPCEEEIDSCRILFQVELAHWFFIDHFYDQDPQNLPNLDFPSFSRLIFDHSPLLQPQVLRLNKLMIDWGKYKSKIPVCGGILLNPSLDKVLLIKPWGGKLWTLPKGKINKEEDYFSCAIREVAEETGFDVLSSSAKGDPSLFLFARVRRKECYMFIFSGVPEDFQFKPQTRKEVSAIQWEYVSKITRSYPFSSSTIHPFLGYLFSPHGFQLFFLFL